MVEVFSWLYVEGFFPQYVAQKLHEIWDSRSPEIVGPGHPCRDSWKRFLGNQSLSTVCYGMLISILYHTSPVVTVVNLRRCQRSTGMPARMRLVELGFHAINHGNHGTVRVRPVIHEAEIERHPSISGFISMSIFETCLSFKKRRFSAFSVICHICHII